MKLSLKIPLLIGIAVLLTVSGIIIIVDRNVSRELTAIAHEEITNMAVVNAELIKSKLDNQLIQLWEIANRTETRTMDWEIIRPILSAAVPRINVLELGIVFPDGSTFYALDDAVANLGDRNYVQAAFAGRSAVSDVLFSRVINAPVVMFGVPIFQSNAPGAPVLGVLIARQATERAMSQLVNEIRSYHPSGYAFMTDRQGTFIAHHNQQLVDNFFNPITEVRNDPSLRSLADMISSAIRQGSGIEVYSNRGVEWVTSYIEIPEFNSWRLFVTVQTADLRSVVDANRRTLLIVGTIFLVIGTVVAVSIGRSISKPILYISDSLKDIPEGEGDLTRTINVRSKDEIGMLAHYFNLTLEKIKNLVINIKKEADTLSGIGGDLASNMNETAAAVNEIVANIQSIKGRIMNQSASVTQTNATMEQLVGNVNKLDINVGKQSQNVQSTSSAIEEMAANIRSVTDTLIKNSVNVQSLIEASEIGRARLNEVVEDIQEIARESDDLMEINSVMENIASQTNLLSMNAAIEAAHAGDAGKGFAVVADEIRKLAESSSEQSKIIGSVLKKMKSSVDKINGSTGNVLEKFVSIESGVKIVAQQEDNIRYSMEEQESGSRQIVDDVLQISEITRQVKDGSNEMLNEAKEVIEESNSLEKATQEITCGMNEMAAGADQINTAVNHVNDISNKNREAIEILISEVSRFTVS